MRERGRRSRKFVSPLHPSFNDHTTFDSPPPFYAKRRFFSFLSSCLFLLRMNEWVKEEGKNYGEQKNHRRNSEKERMRKEEWVSEWVRKIDGKERNEWYFLRYKVYERIMFLPSFLSILFILSSSSSWLVWPLERQIFFLSLFLCFFWVRGSESEKERSSSLEEVAVCWLLLFTYIKLL